MSLLVVGTVAFDSIETPYGKAERIVGGAATYICHAAAQFTNNINLVSVVGEDFPKSEVEKLHQKGVNTAGLQVIAGGKSFFWSGKYHTNMNHRDTLDTQLNVLADFDPILPEAYQSPDYVMLGNLTPAVQLQVLDQLKNKPKLVMLDTMNFWIDIALEDLKKVIARVDVLTINDEEARMLSGEASLVKAAKKIHELGPKYLVIKKGEHGALLFNENQVFFAPALPLEEVFDPTGAGDTFAGGMIGYIAKTDDTSFDNLKRGIIYGSALASCCVEKFGLESIETLSSEALNARVQQFIDLAQFDITL
jgi:sugar/nucleoside kinase (ribokinase family)